MVDWEIITTLSHICFSLIFTFSLVPNFHKKKKESETLTDWRLKMLLSDRIWYATYPNGWKINFIRSDRLFHSDRCDSLFTEYRILCVFVYYVFLVLSDLNFLTRISKLFLFAIRKIQCPRSIKTTIYWKHKIHL